MSTAAYLLSMRVSPRNVDQMRLDLRDLVAAVEAEEWGSDQLEVFAVLRNSEDPGAFMVYGQHSAAHHGRHLTGPLATAGMAAISSHLIEPYERTELDPVSLWGADLGPSSDLTDHEVWLYTVRVPRDGERRHEELAREVMAGMVEEEFATGDVFTYNVHRVCGDPGRYVMVEHFTAMGSRRHAKGPGVTMPGQEQYRRQLAPFSRVPFAPIAALGRAHADLAASALPPNRGPVTSPELPLDWQGGVKELLDRQQILDCIQRCARGMDRHDAELFASAYHPGALDDHGAFRGLASEFVTRLNGDDANVGTHAAQFSTHQHFVQNHVVDLDGDDAHSETYYLFAGHLRDRPQLSLIGGRYLDHLTRRDGRWAIVARRVVIEWTSELASTDEQIAEVLSTFTRGRWDRSDVSYQRPLEVRSAHDAP